MTPKKLDLHMVRGDTLSFGVRIKGLEGELDSAYFSIGQPYPNEDIVIVQKSLGDGIANVGEGEYTVRVAPEDTAQLAPKAYRYDLEIGVGEDIFTPFYGDLYIERGVTQHEVGENE